MIDIKTAIEKVTLRHDLSVEEMTDVMHYIMSGQATPAQIGGFLIGLRMKGETVDEITGAVQVMRELVTPVKLRDEHLIDIVGTGGDSANTFNISTVSAFVVAAAGGRVAKHGNRSVSSHCGSADVLEAAGLRLDLTPEQVAQCVNEVGVGFMFAPQHHAAMQHVLGPRREMGVRTLFNLLGPLTNPANTPNQLIGVYSKQWLRPFAEVCKRLGREHVLVVHAEDGLDEISVGATTQITELYAGQITSYSIHPEQFGLGEYSITELAVMNVEQSLGFIHQVFANKPGAARNVVALNAGAAIYAAGLTNNLSAGVKKAIEVIANGGAKEKFQRLIELSRGFAPKEAG